MSIKFRLGSVITGLSLIICFMFAVTWYTTNAQKSDGLVINLAGRQRMLTQKMSKELLFFVSTDRSEKVAGDVKNTMKIFDITLNALINSGKAPLSLNLDNTAYGICPKPDEPAASQLAEVKKIWNDFSKHMNIVISNEKNFQASLDYVQKNNVKLLKKMNTGVGMLQKLAGKKVKRLIFLQSLCIAAGIVLMAISFFLLLSLFKRLDQTMDITKGMANGDMTLRSEINRHDEIGEIKKSSNRLAIYLDDMLTRVYGNSTTIDKSTELLSTLSKDLSHSALDMSEHCNSVAAAAEEMNANMSAIAAASEETSTNINMVAAAAEEMTSTINGIASNADTAQDITREAVKEARTANERVQNLGNAAKTVSKVTETINSIAEQTNLLALNATIEAARAGEAGKGFAVVANEIKDLAKQTADATQEIKEHIDGIQSSSKQTIDVISTITSTIDKVSEIVTTITTAISEQAQATTEISTNVSQAALGIREVNENIAQASTVNSEVTSDISDINTQSEEVAVHSQDVNDVGTEMYALAQQLCELVQEFKINPGTFDIGAVKIAHFTWKIRMSSVLSGFKQMNAKDVPDHHNCEFGQWFDNASDELKSQPVYKDIETQHKDVHKIVAEAIDLYNQKKMDAARAKVKEFEKIRKDLFASLDKIYIIEG